MRELWDLYNKNRVKLGRTHVRGEQLKQGEYHIVVEIWTMNSNGQILLTKRHANKRFGGLWEATAGSVVATEDSLTGAKRELQEETGIVVEDSQIQFIASITRKDDFVDSYIAYKDVQINELKLQPEEVIDAKWVSLEEFERMNSKKMIVPTVWERYLIYKKVISNKLALE